MLQEATKLWDVLQPTQRRRAVGLVVMMVGSMLLETLGIGLVLPALALLAHADLGSRFPALFDWFPGLATVAPGRLLVAGMLALAAVYTIKCAYVAWSTSRQMRFVYDVQADLSQRLFVGYLAKPYAFHLDSNSSQLIRNVINATNEFTLTGLVSLLILSTEALVLTGIAILLLYVEPWGALAAAGSLAAFGWGLNRLTRRGIVRAGQARHAHEEARIRHLQQALGGVKELKLLGREQGILAQYAPHNAASARIGARQATLQALPKLWLELLAVIGLVVLVLTLVVQGKPLDSLVPTLGVFAAAAFRLIPSMNRILGSMQFIRYSLPTLDTLRGELAGLVPPAAVSGGALPSLGQQLQIEQLQVRYPGADRPVIRNAELRIEAGTTVGLIGESGAGKSTLVDAILGLLPLEGGRIVVDGVDIQRNLAAWQRQIGYVPQAIFLTDDSLRRNIAFGIPDAQIDAAAIERSIAAAQLGSFVATLPAGLDTVVGERGVRLSGGQRQRIGIARALYHNPSVLVLDEATSSLDTETERGVMEAIDALHGYKTILVVTHRPNTLSYCDRVLRLEDGVLVELPGGGRKLS